MAEPEPVDALLPQEDGEEKEGDEAPVAQSTDVVIKSYDLHGEGESEPKRQQNGFGGGEAGAASADGDGEGEEQLVVTEEDGDREQIGPRDDIKVTVTGYQRTADNCTFDVEVHASTHLVSPGPFFFHPQALSFSS